MAWQPQGRGIVKLIGHAGVAHTLAACKQPDGDLRGNLPIFQLLPRVAYRPMNTSPAANLYKRHRFPAEIISHCVWLYFRFCLSYRDVEALMAVRGVLLTYETVRSWYCKFAQHYANQLRHRRPRPRDKWHLDEVFLTINGARHYLWRAVDQDGHGLDILVALSN